MHFLDGLFALRDPLPLHLAFHMAIGLTFHFHRTPSAKREPIAMYYDAKDKSGFYDRTM